MKLIIQMKTPYAIDDAMLEVGKDADKVKEKLAKWFRYEEQITLEYDTETDTMVVVKPCDH